MSGLRRRAAALLVVFALWTGGASVSTDTGASQATGAAPASEHVILISIDGFAAYHLDDLSIDLPNIRALASGGTQADSSETVFPSVTHPSHTTLVSGVMPRRHGVVNNTVTDRRTGTRFHITSLPRLESVLVPTIFDVVRASGGTTASFFWPETRDDPAIDMNIAEVFHPEGGADPNAVTPGLLDELRHAGVPIDTYYDFYDDPYGHGAGDIALTEAAAHVLKTRRPTLTAIHLLITDKAQHEFGPDHYMAKAALTKADHCVGILRRAVEAAGLAATTTFVIAADHGFVTVKDETNVASVLAEPALEGRVRWSTDKWYLFGEQTADFDADSDGPVLDSVLERLAGTAGIARIIRESDYAALGYPDYDDNPYVPGQVIIAAAIDTHLTIDPDRPNGRRPKDEPYHGHGYLPDHPTMFPLLVLSGAGITPGTKLGHVRNVDVAPTIASLLGLEMKGVEGEVIRK